MQTAAARPPVFATDLEQALGERQFYLHYQPIFDLTSQTSWA